MRHGNENIHTSFNDICHRLMNILHRFMDSGKSRHAHRVILLPGTKIRHASNAPGTEIGTDFRKLSVRAVTSVTKSVLVQVAVHFKTRLSRLRACRK